MVNDRRQDCCRPGRSRSRRRRLTFRGLESDPLAVGPVLHENEQQLVAMSAPPSAAVCCSLSAKQVLSRALHILKQSGAQGALLYQNLDGGPEVGIGNEESEAQSREKVEADSWTR